MLQNSYSIPTQFSLPLGMADLNWGHFSFQIMLLTHKHFIRCNFSIITENQLIQHSATMKTKSYSISYKLAALDFLKFHNVSEAARKFNVDRKRIREWREQEKKLREEDKVCVQKKRKRLSGGGRKPRCEELERKLQAWICSRREERLPVSRTMIQRQAMEIFRAFPIIPPTQVKVLRCVRHNEKLEKVWLEWQWYNLNIQTSLTDAHNFQGHIRRQVSKKFSTGACVLFGVNQCVWPIVCDCFFKDFFRYFSISYKLQNHRTNRTW